MIHRDKGLKWEQLETTSRMPIWNRDMLTAACAVSRLRNCDTVWCCKIVNNRSAWDFSFPCETGCSSWTWPSSQKTKWGMFSTSVNVAHGSSQWQTSTRQGPEQSSESTGGCGKRCDVVLWYWPKWDIFPTARREREWRFSCATYFTPITHACGSLRSTNQSHSLK